MSTRSVEIEAQFIERAVEKRNALIAQAERKAGNIVKSAEEDVKRIKAESEEQVLSLVGSELRAVSDRIVGRAQLEGRKMLMESRQELLSKVFEEAERRLKEMTEKKGAEHGNILVKLIIESASAIEGEDFIVAANELDLKYLRRSLKRVNNELEKALGGGTVKLDEEPLDVMGGVVVRNVEGTKTHYNTLEGRLASARGRIEAEVAKTLGLI